MYSWNTREVLLREWDPLGGGGVHQGAPLQEADDGGRAQAVGAIDS